MNAQEVESQPLLFRALTPEPPLGRFVEHIWYWDGPARPHMLERIMPSGTASIIINLFEDETRGYDGDTVQRASGAVIVGAQSISSMIDTAEQRTVIGVGFRAGGSWPFFDMSSDELLNGTHSLAEVWGPEASSLRERILRAPTPAARLQVLEAALRRHIARPLETHPAVRFALGRLHHAPELESIETLSRLAGFSARRMARLFALEVGLTPKLYARVLRFTRVLDATHRAQSVDWGAIAQQCGYFDQPHFIRDFREFSGLTPTEYMARRTPFAHHVRA